MNQDFPISQDLTPESFCGFLRQSRIRQQKTMGQVARDLGITVVYYSEVEAGKKAAFPDGKVDYRVLAESLGVAEFTLKRSAEMDREKRQIIKAFGCTGETADLAVAFGRRLTNNDLTEKQKTRIRRILNEVE
jgi:transcriptional regulator with XRE-family HTH domain